MNTNTSGAPGTEIIVSGREYKVTGDVVDYQQIVDIWNELHKPEGVHIIGTPGIAYEMDKHGHNGILWPQKTLEVQDGTQFSVDPSHVS